MIGEKGAALVLEDAQGVRAGRELAQAVPA
jgi:hypothetical protein